MSFGGGALSKKCYDKIKELVPVGGVILEFGSGDGSVELVDAGYRVFSVEHDKKWVDKYESVNYIYAPLVLGWYDLKEVPGHDLIIVDGPPAYSRDKMFARIAFFDTYDLYNSECPIIVDDVNRPGEKKLVDLLVERKGYTAEFFIEAEKSFAVLTK